MRKSNITGYITGFVLFVILIPVVMFMSSENIHYTLVRACLFLILSVLGLGLSIWSIIYMRCFGKGNPMDVFNYEIRTRELMVDGPYKICRNPMLLGIFIYYIGILIFLVSYNASVIFIIFAVLMMYRVYCEEKRLENDFGEKYIEYKNKTKKLIPFIW